MDGFPAALIRMAGVVLVGMCVGVIPARLRSLARSRRRRRRRVRGMWSSGLGALSRWVWLVRLGWSGYEMDVQ